MFRNRRIMFLVILAAGFFLRLYYVFVSPYSKCGVKTCDICTIGLMAKHILGGEFPLFFYGQYYLGPFEAVVTAFFFAVFGIKIQVVYFSVLFFSVLFIVITYFLGKILRNSLAGLFSMLYAAFPPRIFFGESVTPAGYHIEMPFLGSLLFLITLLICNEKNRRKKGIYYAVLGITAGIGIWTHYIFLYYIVPAGIYLLINEKFILLLRNGILAVLSGIAASLPFWVFTFRNNFCTFGFKTGPARGMESYNALLKAFFCNIMSMLGIDRGFEHFLVLTVYAAMVLYFIFKTRVRQSKEFLFSFFIIFVAWMYILYRSRMYAGESHWYLIPVISFIPVCFGYFTERIVKKNRFVGIAFAIVIILVNIRDIRNFIGKEAEASREDGRLYSEKIEFLEERNLYRLIGNDRMLRELEFFTNEKIIGTAFECGDYYPHEDEVDASERVAFELNESNWRPSLDNVCESFRFENKYYFDFKPHPYLVEAIPKDNWHAVSNKDTFSAYLAFDRNIDSWWLSGGKKKPGDYFKIDLGREYKICCVRMYNKHYISNNPNGLKIEVSRNGEDWREACRIESVEPTFWSGPRIYWRYINGRIECFFEPQNARYIKLVNLRDDSENPWGIKEIFVYEYTGEKLCSVKEQVREIKKIISFLNRHRINFVYADFWPSAKIRKLTGDKISALVPYNSWLPRRRNMDRDVFLARDKVLLAAKEDFLETEKILKEAGIDYSKRDFDKYVCYYFPDLEERYEAMPGLMWLGPTLAKHSLKEYSSWLYDTGDYEKALKYYSNNFSAFLKCGGLPSTRFIPQEERNILFANGIRFLGYSIRTKKIKPGRMIRIEYFWEVEREHESGLSMFVHFINDGKIAFQNDHKFLYQFQHPLNPLAGERFREVLKLIVPQDKMPGVYKIEIGLWDEDTRKRIYIKDLSGKKVNRQLVGELSVE